MCELLYGPGADPINIIIWLAVFHENRGGCLCVCVLMKAKPSC